jgi:hypothetical protein
MMVAATLLQGSQGDNAEIGDTKGIINQVEKKE